jgi:hypothetical protein
LDPAQSSFCHRQSSLTEHRSNGRQPNRRIRDFYPNNVSSIRTTPVEDQKRNTKKQGNSEFDRQ